MEEIIEVHVGGEIAATGEAIKFRSRGAFVMVISAQGAPRVAMVDVLGGSSVIDGETCSGLPEGDPGGKPLLIAFVDLDSLAFRPLVTKEGGVREFIAGNPTLREALLSRGEEEFVPTVSLLEDADREGVDQFVGENEGLSSSYPECVAQ